MTKRPKIFINEDFGSYLRTEIRRLSKVEKLEIMEAWFRERYEGPANSTPRWDNEFHFIHGGPYDARDEIQSQFGGLVSDSIVETLIEKLQREEGDWAPTSKYRDDGDDSDSDDGPLQLGSDDERHMRGLVLDRLNRLEELLAIQPAPRGKMGHNQPPKDISDDDRAELDTLAATVAEIKAELENPLPAVPVVTQQFELVVGIKERLQEAAARKIDMATDEFAKAFGKELGKSLGRLVFWGPLLVTLSGLIIWLESWLQALGAAL